MVGALMARGVRKPAKETINEALDLLVALGGNNPRAKELLEELREIQTINEAAFSAAQDAIAEANERVVAAKAAEDSATAARQRLVDETAEAVQSLSDQRAELAVEDTRLRAWGTELQVRHDDLAPRETRLRAAFEGWSDG